MSVLPDEPMRKASKSAQRTGRLNVRASPEEQRMLETLAKMSGLSASDVVRTLIRNEFKAKTKGTDR